MHGTRPLAPEEFTASLWEEVNALKEAFDTTCVCVDKEENDQEGRMNLEPTELELPSADTGLKHPDSSVPRTRRLDEPPPTAIRCWHGFKSGGKHFFTHGTR